MNDSPIEFTMHVHRQQNALAVEVAKNRLRAHAKHVAESIEGGTSGDRLMAILTEEVGEVATELNDFALGKYTSDEHVARIRAELIDVIAVASAWVAKLKLPASHDDTF